MTPDRLRALLEGFGADPRRWPEAERDAARALLSGDPARRPADAAALDAALADAALLDRELDAWRVDSPSAALCDRVVAGAPSPGAGRRARRSWRPLAPFWPRAGWAAAGLAGAFAGALVVSVALADNSVAAADWQKRSTAFSERGADWSEE